MQPCDPDFVPAPVAVIGGGPAGLMAAEQLLAAGFAVDLFDAMPSVGRKFLLAGVGGMNLTHSENAELFLSRYQNAAAREWLAPMLEQFSATELRAWAQCLGVSTFVGSSGRVFPTDMKAAPLLRAWLHRLKSQGLRLWVRHRWLGFTAGSGLRFAHRDQEFTLRYGAVVMALGGASWPKLGSTGEWLSHLADLGLQTEPWQASNGGFRCAWSDRMKSFAGQPLKVVAAAASSNAQDSAPKRRGEFVITEQGVEGSLVYALSNPLRGALSQGKAYLLLDLMPQKTPQQLQALLEKPRGKASFSKWLKSRLSFDPLKLALLHELSAPDSLQSLPSLVQQIKHLPLPILAAQPIAEAISSAGGLDITNLDPQLMLQQMPGVFVAGEMLNWDAPTGGYLLTACFSQGRRAGRGAAAYLADQSR